MTRLQDRLHVAISRTRGFVGANVFDRHRGIDTSRIVDQAEAGVHVDGRIPYVPSSADVFLDLGSGRSFTRRPWRTSSRSAVSCSKRR